ncbi:hypothetical protein K435DRAFT_805735 [Dendrothele bispora CBS 962.96]|uniref:Uncharacterized protein n=1 Tax=Dendrothele bispora (strain CBS 962.96) TaxID=1314807 RepID=A0A4S8LA29_DENBC|nr:hypothetical protein K435DRAFT_805735 [Dendrothele bispora CBS 962.96]
MPSLRRTVSSPAVRSSPYPSTAPSAAQRVHGNGHRRSTGSEIVSRRVLADIEWWRVADGQRDLEAEQELEDANNDREPSPIRTNEELAPAIGFSAPSDIAGVERPFTPAWSSIILASMSEDIPLHHFSASSVVPRTPPRRGHSLESSTSSLESTPEVPTEGPIEGIRLGMEYLDLVADDFLPPSRVLRNTNNENPRSLDASQRRSLVDLLPSPPSADYADYVVSPLSSHSPQFCN